MLIASGSALQAVCVQLHQVRCGLGSANHVTLDAQLSADDDQSLRSSTFSSLTSIWAELTFRSFLCAAACMAVAAAMVSVAAEVRPTLQKRALTGHKP